MGLAKGTLPYCTNGGGVHVVLDRGFCNEEGSDVERPALARFSARTDHDGKGVAPDDVLPFFNIFYTSRSIHVVDATVAIF